VVYDDLGEQNLSVEGFAGRSLRGLPVVVGPEVSEHESSGAGIVSGFTSLTRREMHALFGEGYATALMVGRLGDEEVGRTTEPRVPRRTRCRHDPALARRRNCPRP